MRTVLRDRRMRGALLSVLASSILCAPLITFVPVLVRDVFQGGAGHFSMGIAAFGVGGLLGALALLAVEPDVDQRWVSAGFGLAFAAVLVLIAFTSWIWALPVLLVLAGAAMTIGNTAANSVLQSSAEPQLLGRAVSLYMLALRGGISVGALVTGAMVTLAGVQRALLINGLLALLCQLVVAWTCVREPRPPRRAR
jgi:predicted MFS family arabinose efflux permease